MKIAVITFKILLCLFLGIGIFVVAFFSCLGELINTGNERMR